MNWFLNFILWCVTLAVCLGIGLFVIQFAFGALGVIIALLISGINWVCQKLSGK